MHEDLVWLLYQSFGCIPMKSESRCGRWAYNFKDGRWLLYRILSIAAGPRFIAFAILRMDDLTCHFRSAACCSLVIGHRMCTQAMAKRMTTLTNRQVCPVGDLSTVVIECVLFHAPTLDDLLLG